MKYLVKNFNRATLRILSEKYPDRWDRIKSNKKFKWLTGEDYPTFNQLIEVAKVFNIPFGYLFLDELPEEKLEVPFYRTVPRDKEAYSEDLRDLILQLKKWQNWCRDILEDLGQEPLPYAGKFSPNSSVNEVVEAIREILNLEKTWAQRLPSWSSAFYFLLEKIESAGVFVVVSGIVGNNTHRKISVEDCRGFVLFDPIAPFVFINNNDFVSAKIFTLIHEFVHILIGQSASFDLQDLQSADNAIEKFCDACTAEFLVPGSFLKEEKDFTIENLARKYRVSQIVIARRLMDLGLISKKEYKTFYDQYARKELREKLSSGGDFYVTAKYRYSARFLGLLYSALKSEKILYRDVMRLLSLSSGTLEKLFQRVIHGKKIFA